MTIHKKILHVTKQSCLPHLSSSFQFVGEDHADAQVSIFFVEAIPGKGAPLHMHKYDEVIVVQSGHCRVVASDVIKDALAGDVVLIKAGTPHGFVNAGTELLIQIDIHLNRRFEQENLAPTELSRRVGLPEL